MGTARAFVAESGSWPAWICVVSNPQLLVMENDPILIKVDSTTHIYEMSVGSQSVSQLWPGAIIGASTRGEFEAHGS